MRRCKLGTAAWRRAHLAGPHAEVLCAQVGYGKEVLSRGRFAELLQDNRPLSQDESAYFDRSAEFAYASFRDKAAASRGMEIDEMQELAQGRVWSGMRAASKGCVASRAQRVPRIPDTQKRGVRLRVAEKAVASTMDSAQLLTPPFAPDPAATSASWR